MRVSACLAVQTAVLGIWAEVPPGQTHSLVILGSDAPLMQGHSLQSSSQNHSQNHPLVQVAIMKLVFPPQPQDPLTDPTLSCRTKLAP